MKRAASAAFFVYIQTYRFATYAALSYSFGPCYRYFVPNGTDSSLLQLYILTPRKGGWLRLLKNKKYEIRNGGFES
jgi:hypothetical protein